MSLNNIFLRQSTEVWETLFDAIQITKCRLLIVIIIVSLSILVNESLPLLSLRYRK